MHERVLAAPLSSVANLVASLASTHDRLWPHQCWPRIHFDRPLGVGATGGHGPINYVVEHCEPNDRVTFRFTGPSGFDGSHHIEIIPHSETTTLVRHVLTMRTTGVATLNWSAVVRPLHNALVEDVFTTAEASLGLETRVERWSLWVKTLRFVIGRGRKIPQQFPQAKPASEKTRSV